jgi:RNA polymerase sigma-70 factor (ECF subfamily)
MTIEEIIIGCKANDVNAQSELYKLTYNNLLGVCKRYTKNMDEANDLLQDGFMFIISRMHSFMGDDLKSITGFACTIMRNKVIDDYRRSKSKRAKTIKFDSIDFSFSDYTNIECSEYSDDNFDIYFDCALLAIDELTPRYKQIVEMFYLDNMKHPQIANELGISVGTSKSSLSRAMRNLKKSIKNLQIIE